MKGSKFEIAVWTGLVQAARAIRPFKMSSQGAVDTLDPSVLPRVDCVIHYSLSTSSSERNLAPEDEYLMWIPAAENHAGFDFILQYFDRRRIVFIQASINKPQEDKDSSGD